LTNLQHLRTVYFGSFYFIDEVCWDAQHGLVVAVDVFEGLGGELRTHGQDHRSEEKVYKLYTHWR
jgi:hypothetical protein